MSTIHRITVPPCRWLGARLAGIRRRLRQGHRTQPVIHHSTPQGRVECVPDPRGRLTLVGVRGELSASLRQELARCLASIPDGSALHLDVSDARLPSSVAVFELASLIDELEDRHVAIRIVGLDPRLPATECHTPSS